MHGLTKCFKIEPRTVGYYFHYSYYFNSALILTCSPGSVDYGGIRFSLFLMCSFIPPIDSLLLCLFSMFWFLCGGSENINLSVILLC
jgi:hypothetical protein